MRKRVAGLLAAVLLAVGGGYLVIEMIPLLVPGYEYQTAIQYTLSDGISVDGVAVRQETPLGAAQTVFVDYLVEDGSRVSAGSAVAEVFNDSVQSETRATEKRLTEEIEMLNRSQDPSLAAQGNAELLVKQQQQDLYTLLRLTDTGNYDGLWSAKSSVTCSANRLQIATGRAQSFDARIGELTALRDAAMATVGQVGYVYADRAGYFSSRCDGLEETLTQQAMDEMSPDEAQQMISQASLPGGNGAGRIISDYQWYFYCVVEGANVQRFEDNKGKKITIDFHYTGVQEVPATIVSIKKDETGQKALVKLACTYVNADTVNLRYENASINFKSYSGLRIDAKAKHIVDGKNGVYVRFGNLVQFKAITALYENDEYILVPVQTKASDSSNQVVLYDEIIVSGKNLYDGKLI